MSGFGTLVAHASTVCANTVIAVERGSRGPLFVRVRRAGVVTYEERWHSEVRARSRFEAVVERHEKGESL